MGNIKDIHFSAGDIAINISADRLNHNLLMAMDMLGERILMDSTKFVPTREGTLRNSGYVETSGTSGEVIWSAPYAHYQHEGILYVGQESGSSFAKMGEKKIPAEPEKKLSYSTPGTGSHWFETAKQEYGDDWIDMVKKEAGK